VSSKPSVLPALVLVLASIWCEAATAHDPSAYGGLFRTRNWGENWLNADVGLFLGAAIALAIHPTEPNHLLLGTDSGLLLSRNGGRNWIREAPDKLYGAVFAVTFLPGGTAALCATPGGVHRYDGTQWSRVPAPAGAAPARAIAAGTSPGQLYLIGRRDLFASGDGGLTWLPVEHDLPDGSEFSELTVATQPQEVLFAIVDGSLMASSDRGTHWEKRQSGIAGERVEGLSLDAAVPARIWVASNDRIYRSDDGGRAWAPVGAALPEAGTSVRGVVADPQVRALTVATHRGLYRSADSGASWQLLEDNLPVHLEARPLLPDRSATGTIYAGFALMPYAEMWRTALEGGNLLSRIDPISLAGGLAFLLLLILLGTVGARWLLRRRATDPLRTS
jgi:photosystem II stability/assembly factor-like uncharacterized protein